MTVRLPYALWGLLQQSLLDRHRVTLTPRIKRKFAKKTLAHQVHSIAAPGHLDSSSLVTVAKRRAVRQGQRDVFTWDLSLPIGGKIV